MQKKRQQINLVQLLGRFWSFRMNQIYAVLFSFQLPIFYFEKSLDWLAGDRLLFGRQLRALSISIIVWEAIWDRKIEIAPIVELSIDWFQLYLGLLLLRRKYEICSRHFVRPSIDASKICYETATLMA